MPSSVALDYFHKNSERNIGVVSGVFKGRRARHLPRAPPFWVPPLQVLRAYSFLIFGEKRIIHSYNGLQSRS